MARLLFVFVLLLTVPLPAQVIFDKSLPASFTTLDAAGNIYTTDQSTITRLDPSGNVIYSKALPLFAANWSAIAADAVGEIVIAGNTQYDNLPTSANVVQPTRNNKGTCISGDKGGGQIPCTDAFILKLDSSGNLAWATYLGGIGNDGATAVALDPSGNVYVAGSSGSADFPLQQPLQSGTSGGFLAEISSTGTKLLFSTYLTSSGSASATRLKLDSNGNLVIAGNALNPVFPPTSLNPPLPCPAGGTTTASTGFFAVVNSAGTRVIDDACLGSSTPSLTSVADLALDASNNIYLTGTTNAPDFPVTAGSYQPNGPSASTYVAKFSTNSGLVYATRFAGSPGPSSIAVDRAGEVYVAGQIFGSVSLAIAGPARQTCAGPAALENRFLVKLSADGSRALYSSFDDPTVFNATLAVGPDDALVETYIPEPNVLNGHVTKIANIDSITGPLFSQFCVLNGASFASHYPTYPLLPGISPGEIVTLKGHALGPERASTTNVAVTFDGIPVWVLYAQDQQINVVAPYEITGKTAIQVTYLGNASPIATLPVSTVSPAIFLNFDTGQPLVLNADFTVNSPSHPLTKGWVLVLYITGGGQTTPASYDGEISPGIGGLVAPVSAELSINGVNGTPIVRSVPVQYAGPSPGLTSGVQQINVTIPTDLPSSYFAAGTSAFLTVTIGDQQVTAQVYGIGGN